MQIPIVIEYFLQVFIASIVHVGETKLHITECRNFKQERIFLSVGDAHASVVIERRDKRDPVGFKFILHEQWFLMTGSAVLFKQLVSGFFLIGKAGLTTFDLVIF